MIDIHSHILPGMDDGAASLDVSLAMLRIAAEDGTTDIVASPHANHEYQFDPDERDRRIEELQQATDANIRIHKACDFHLSYDNIEDSLAHPCKYAINNKRYVLVEFSDLLIPKTTDDVFHRMQQQGMIPVITHPERNMLLQKRLEKLEAWVESGCLLQVTAHSFLGRFGKRAKAFSDLLLQKGLIHIVASDAHDTEHRPPKLRAAYTYVCAAAGEAVAELLFVSNPRATLTGDPAGMPGPVDPASPRKWYQVWRPK